MCYVTPEVKFCHKIYDVLFRTHLTACVCTKLHVCTSKNVAFLVTEFIYIKTGLFRIISVYLNAELYFVHVINYCEAVRLKFVAPG